MLNHENEMSQNVVFEPNRKTKMKKKKKQK